MPEVHSIPDWARQEIEYFQSRKLAQPTESTVDDDGGRSSSIYPFIFNSQLSKHNFVKNLLIIFHENISERFMANAAQLDIFFRFTVLLYYM